jgi:enoyl-CoA hydratase/carnithine racemase
VEERLAEIEYVAEAEGIGALVINRPEKRNAFNGLMRRQLYDLLLSDEVAELKVLLVRAEGTVFCAGVDLNEVAQQDRRHLSGRMTADMWRQFRRARPIIIAGVQGGAYGLGAGLAMACDIIVAGESAQFGYPEIEHGLVASFATVGLQHVVGLRKAFELVITGRRVKADEALALGMVNEVVPDDQIRARCDAFAQRLAGFSPEALQTQKQFFYEAIEMPFSVASLTAERVVQMMRRTRGAQERAAAFVAKGGRTGEQA